MMSWGAAVPILRVEDLRESLQYYTNVLGFHLDWVHVEIASVTRDDCTVFLCEGDQTNGRTWIWIGVPDVEELERELRAKGAHIRQPPTNFDWALEMQVMDLDGNILRIGSEPQPGKAFGPWLDAHGRLWYAQPDGSWRAFGSEAAPQIN
jgi:catechol 2,3-dioxygenase-like lactoylglutathione lyase family enzyme